MRARHWNFWFWVKLCCVFCALPIANAFAAQAPIDVRVLVDVSGSMKSNDPKNLRIPAVRLVAELMPLGAKAGVWMFSESVEPLIEPNLVDSAWKVHAEKQLAKIHSRGQFTDIEAGLKAASADWLRDLDETADRHIILLTDGVVDVSKDTSASAASRRRILDEQIRRLKSAGARVHTIALSANSDRELLTELAKMTEAWAEQVEDAAALQRVFLHMFEQAAQPDSVPLDGNSFTVDSSISEMTLLVFTGEEGEALQLSDPSGTVFSNEIAAENVKWRRENGYELVTVKAPKTGKWQINTEPDPDNRVMIVTDLKLELGALPTSLMAQESVAVSVHISESGERVVRKDFLELIQAKLAITTTGAASGAATPLTFDSKTSAFIDERMVDWPPGDYEFVVHVDGGTFQREQRAKIRIHGAPFMFSTRLVDDGLSVATSIEAVPELVKLDSLSGLLVMREPDGASAVFDLAPFDGNRSELNVPVSINGTHSIEPRILGQTTSGRLINLKLDPAIAEIVAAKTTEPPPSEAPAEQPSQAIDWFQSMAVVSAGNIVIAVLLGLVWLLLGRKRAVPDGEVVVQ